MLAAIRIMIRITFFFLPLSDICRQRRVSMALWLARKSSWAFKYVTEQIRTFSYFFKILFLCFLFIFGIFLFSALFRWNLGFCRQVLRWYGSIGSWQTSSTSCQSFDPPKCIRRRVASRQIQFGFDLGFTFGWSFFPSYSPWQRTLPWHDHHLRYIDYCLLSLAIVTSVIVFKWYYWYCVNMI
jgi:hypothetical protein